MKNWWWKYVNKSCSSSPSAHLILFNRQRQTGPWWGLLGSMLHEERQWSGQQWLWRGRWRRRGRWRWWKWRKLQPVPGASHVGPHLTCRRGALPASVHGLGGVSHWKRNGQHAQQQQLQFRPNPIAELPVGRAQPELPVPTALISIRVVVLVPLFLVFPIPHRSGGGPAAGPWRRDRLSSRWVSSLPMAIKNKPPLVVVNVHPYRRFMTAIMQVLQAWQKPKETACPLPLIWVGSILDERQSRSEIIPMSFIWLKNTFLWSGVKLKSQQFGPDKLIGGSLVE